MTITQRSDTHRSGAITPFTYLDSTRVGEDAGPTTAPAPDEEPQLERLRTTFRTDHESHDPAADPRALVFVLDAQESQPGSERLRALLRAAGLEVDADVARARTSCPRRWHAAEPWRARPSSALEAGTTTAEEAETFLTGLRRPRTPATRSCR